MSANNNDGLICYNTGVALQVYTPGDLIAGLKTGEIKPGKLAGQYRDRDGKSADPTSADARDMRKHARTCNLAVFAAWAAHIPGFEPGEEGSLKINGETYTIADIQAGALDDWATAADEMIPDDLTLPEPEAKPVPAAKPTVKASPAAPVKPAAPPSRSAAPPQTVKPTAPAPATPTVPQTSSSVRTRPTPSPQAPPTPLMVQAPPAAPLPTAPTGSPVINAADFDALARLAPLLGGKVETVTIVTLTLPDGRSFTRA